MKTILFTIIFAMTNPCEPPTTTVPPVDVTTTTVVLTTEVTTTTAAPTTTEVTTTTAAPTTTTTLVVEREGDQVTPELPEGQCWIPSDLMDVFIGLNYAPCDEIEAARVVDIPETSVTVEQSAPAVVNQSLPETGSDQTIGFILLGIALVLGGWLLTLWANDREPLRLKNEENEES